MALPMLRAFAPTPTETYSFCPRKWGLSRAGYRPRVIDYPQMCAFIGTGFAAGAALVNGAVKLGQPRDLELTNTAVWCAQEVAKNEIDRWILAGASIAPKDENVYDKLPALIEAAVTLFVAKYPHEGEILAAEKSYPEFGNARIDLLYKRKVDSRLVVLDYKVKVKITEKWFPKEVAAYEKSSQLYEYCHIAGTTDFEIAFIILAPLPHIKVASYRIDPAYNELFLWDQARLWGEMAPQADLPFDALRGNRTHEDKWGLCDYAEDGCLRGDLSPEALAMHFIKLPERVK